MTALPWRYDDGGRADAGFTGVAPGDCVTRAIALVTGEAYRAVYDQINRTAGKAVARTGVPNKVTRSVIAHYGGLWTPLMGIGTGCTMRLAAGEFPATGRYIAKVSKHVCAVIDGVVVDTHDPTREGTRCVYGFWAL